jgi:tetratricopeptide (TPR) repeat protein
VVPAASVASELQVGAAPCGCHGAAATKGISERSPSQLFEAAKQNPKDAKVHFAIATYYEQQHLFHAALEEYAEADRLNPKDPEFMLSQIQLLLATKDFESVEVLARQAERRFPNIVKFPMFRYLAYKGSRQSCLSEECLDEVLRSKNQSPEWIFSQATILSMRGQYSASLRLCQRLQNEHRGFLPTFILKGSILKHLGRNQEAFQAITQGFDEVPYSIVLCKIFLNYLHDENRMDLALEPALALFALSQTDSKNSQSQVRLMAMSFLMQTSPKHAESIIQKVSAKLPDKNDSSTFQKSIGDIYDNINNPELALSHYAQAISLKNPSSEECLRVARYAETRALNWTEALEQYSRASALSPRVQQESIERTRTRLSQRKNLVSNDLAFQLKFALHQTLQSQVSNLMTATQFATQMRKPPSLNELLSIPSKRQLSFRQPTNQ